MGFRWDVLDGISQFLCFTWYVAPCGNDDEWVSFVIRVLERIGGRRRWVSQWRAVSNFKYSVFLSFMMTVSGTVCEHKYMFISKEWTFESLAKESEKY